MSQRMSRRRLLGAVAMSAAGLAGCAPPLPTMLGGGTPTPVPAPATPQATPTSQAQALIAQINAATPAGPDTSVVIDLAQKLRPISPHIYGLAGGSDALVQQVRPTLGRWGGNPATRYNWQRGNAWNTDRDWKFNNTNYGHTAAADQRPSGVADASVAANRQHGIATLITIPAIGWVAKDDLESSASIDVPKAGGPPLANGAPGAIAGYDPAANRKRTSVPSVASRASGKAPADAVAQDEWVRHFVGKFGDAAHGGVTYYAVDNEPDLWDSTHTDIHPVRMGYDAMLAMFIEYATAIKAADPSALVTGPVVSGWTGMYYSALDRGSDNFQTAADRSAHMELPFLPWWLDQVGRHDDQTGKRSLDVLDVHWYPQGGEFANGKDPTDAAANARRLRSTRSLWDPTYVDESWIAKTWDEDLQEGIVKLIPRLRDWITQHYPGTKIGITEWNWGADGTPNGGLAIALVLGIFGREGVDIATYWTAPKEGTPGALAFQAYRNFDGQGGQFGDTAIVAASSDPGRVASFAGLDSKTGALTTVIVNQDPAQQIPIRVHLNNAPVFGGAAGYQYRGDDAAVLRKFDIRPPTNGQADITLPPTSITVLHFTGA